MARSPFRPYCLTARFLSVHFWNCRYDLGFVMTNALGSARVSPRMISKSSTPCRKRFMRTMEEVIKLRSWP